MKLYVAEGVGYDGSAIYGIFSMRADAIAYLEEAITKEKSRDNGGFTDFDQYTVRETELNRGVPDNSSSDVVFDMEAYNDAVCERYLLEEVSE